MARWPSSARRSRQAARSSRRVRLAGRRRSPSSSGRTIADIQHLAFTPDGGQLRDRGRAGAMDGRPSSVWDANTGAPLQTLLGGSGCDREHASVHPLSGELLVGGPNARAWSLTGAPEKWTLRCGSIRVAASPSGDRTMWSLLPAPGHNAALQKLQAGSPELLWKPANGPSIASPA